MEEKLSKSNYISICVELLGIFIMSGGMIFEYIYGRDLFLFFITFGGIIFSIGSGLVNKFPWSHIRGLQYDYSKKRW